MGCSESGTDAYTGGGSAEIPEHNATVASFALDKYEVTVGRLRSFVNAYDTWYSGGNPKDNPGAHPIATSTGWGKSWTATTTDLPATLGDLVTSLKCNSTNQTWTDTARSNESYAILCDLVSGLCIVHLGRRSTTYGSRVGMRSCRRGTESTVSVGRDNHRRNLRELCWLSVHSREICRKLPRGRRLLQSCGPGGLDVGVGFRLVQE